MSFISELQRRKVLKVAGIYLVAAWVVLQVTDVLSSALALPGWALTLVLYILVSGFPVTLVLSWYFDLTLAGFRQDARDRERGLHGLRASLALSAAAVVVSIAGIYYYRGLSGTDTGGDTRDTPAPAASTAPEKSIAVLPFVNLSTDPDQGYFADGLAEELLNQLARVQDLQVAARTSSFYFKGRNEDMRKIGQALDVSYILEGSVRKSGTQIRVTAQLIKADDGFHLWSLTYDRSLDEIFAIQEEIAEAVTTALSVSLGVGEFQRPGMTRNIEAYDIYLHGLASLKVSDLNVINNSIELFQQAVNLDPEFGLAWLKLHEAYDNGRLLLPAEQTGDFLKLSREALDRAGTVAPGMPEYQVTQAEFFRRSGQWLQAENLFTRVLQETGSSNARANYLYGHLLASVGRSTDALPYLYKARRLDPYTPNIATQIVRVLVGLGRYREAEAEAARGIALGNARETLFINSILLMSAYSQQDFNRALIIVKKLVPDTGDVSYRLVKLLAQGDRDGAIEILTDLAADQTISPVMNSAFSVHAAAAGDSGLSLQFLQKQANANLNDFFGSNPMWHKYFSAVRRTEGFKTLARKAGVADYWRATGKWGDFCHPLEGEDFECR